MTIKWPGNRTFAFSIFDDPDSQTVTGLRAVYDYLSDAGLRTTVGVWPYGPTRERNSDGETCCNLEYRKYVRELSGRGFEIGFHLAAPHSCSRQETASGLDAFADYFGDFPITMANHYNSEAIYWGKYRLGGVRQRIYVAATLTKNTGRFSGNIEDSPYFWGDLCKEKVRFCRNFTYEGINTLASCPWMPYHDPERQYVNYWFASSDGKEVQKCRQLLCEQNQDALESQGGACIVYTHFGLGFVREGVLDERFRMLIDRLRQKNGWFVPVGTLLEYLRAQRPDVAITSHQRRNLEWRWLRGKLFRGCS
ncbi:MAG: hypothetical protein JO356_00455 [Acidobacteria bacterium]|nr:hypothetical protein [Acidobacteriota bacterium]